MSFVESLIKSKSGRLAPVQKPKEMIIACDDARIPVLANHGEAFQERTIGGVVLPNDRKLGATLEFFVRHLTSPDGGPREINVFGHEECGLMRAVQTMQFAPEDSFLEEYVSQLTDMRERVLAKAAEDRIRDEETILWMLIFENVRSGIANLLGYKSVREAVDQGTIKLNGYVIGLSEERLWKMDDDFRGFTEVDYHKVVPRQQSLSR